MCCVYVCTFMYVHCGHLATAVPSSPQLMQVTFYSLSPVLVSGWSHVVSAGNGDVRGPLKASLGRTLGLVD